MQLVRQLRQTGMLKMTVYVLHALFDQHIIEFFLHATVQTIRIISKMHT